MDDASIRALVARLSRPHSSGGDVIERAAILAEGADFADVVTWITDHSGRSETAAVAPRGGLHSARLADSAGAGATPLRYILPAGALD
jgi:hypothetical protein